MKTIAGAIFLFFAMHGAAYATPVLSFSGAIIGGTGAQTHGWRFDVNSSVTVTHLGVWDRNADGLSESHQVGIWDSTGTLLTSATVLSGTTAPLDSNGLFRLVDIPDIVLAPAARYRVGALYILNSGDNLARDATTLTVDPSISYGAYQFANGSSLTFPTISNSFITNGLWGPSFEVVPEPSTLVLLGAVLLAAALRSPAARSA